MSDLSARARLAIEAMQDDTGSEEHRARVRARLTALGICASAAGAASAAGVSTLAGQVGGPAVAAAPTAAPSSAAAGAQPAAASVLGAANANAALVSGAGTLAKLSALGIGAKISAVVIVLAGVGVLQLSRQSPRARRAESAPRAAEQSVAAPAVAAIESEAAPATSEVNPPPLAPSALETPRAPPRARAARRTRSAADPGANLDLEAESALMAAALKALRAGQTDRARFLCDVHERDFGAHALLARERERMRRELEQTLR